MSDTSAALFPVLACEMLIVIEALNVICLKEKLRFWVWRFSRISLKKNNLIQIWEFLNILPHDRFKVQMLVFMSFGLML